MESDENSKLNGLAITVKGGHCRGKKTRRWSSGQRPYYFFFNLKLIGIIISDDDEFYGGAMRILKRKGGRRFMK